MKNLCPGGSLPVKVKHIGKGEFVFTPRHKCFSNHLLCQVCRDDAQTLNIAIENLGGEDKPICAACDYCETEDERNACPIRKIGIETVGQLKEIGKTWKILK